MARDAREGWLETATALTAGQRGRAGIIHRMQTMNDNPKVTQLVELLERIATALERIDRTLDEHAGAHLNARYPYGRPTDRWRRSA